MRRLLDKVNAMLSRTAHMAAEREARRAAEEAAKAATAADRESGAALRRMRKRLSDPRAYLAQRAIEAERFASLSTAAQRREVVRQLKGAKERAEQLGLLRGEIARLRCRVLTRSLADFDSTKRRNA